MDPLPRQCQVTRTEYTVPSFLPPRIGFLGSSRWQHHRLGTRPFSRVQLLNQYISGPEKVAASLFQLVLSFFSVWVLVKMVCFSQVNAESVKQ